MLEAMKIAVVSLAILVLFAPAIIDGRHYRYLLGNDCPDDQYIPDPNTCLDDCWRTCEDMRLSPNCRREIECPKNKYSECYCKNAGGWLHLLTSDGQCVLDYECFPDILPDYPDPPSYDPYSDYK